MAIEALNELPESTSLPATGGIVKDAEGWAKDATVRLGEDYAKIVRALQGLDSADANAILKAIMEAKGDLIGATAADTPVRLGVGANGTVLTADSAEATGLKWVAPVVQQVKAWAHITMSGGVPTLADSFNVSGIVDNGVGDITVEWATDFANATYAVSAILQQGAADRAFVMISTAAGAIAVGSARFIIVKSSNEVLTDDYKVLTVIAVGDQ